VVAATVYLLSNASTITTSEAILTFVMAPVLQGLVVLVYGALGYPVYVYLAKRGVLGLADPLKDDSTRE